MAGGGALPEIEVALKRLQHARDEADKRYNDALTALDAAVHLFQELPDFPAPPPPFDEHQITPLNRLWKILPAEPPAGSGWRGRLALFVWRLVWPMLRKQEEFNSALVDHVNRNVKGHRDARASLELAVAVLRDQIEKLVTFQSRLIVYLQEITLYVDTRDREVAGRLAPLAGAISGVGDELMKRWEALGSVQQATLMLKREVEWLAGQQAAGSGQQAGGSRQQAAASGGARSIAPSPSPSSVVPGFSRTSPGTAAGSSAPVGRSLSSGAAAGELDWYKYLGFEDRFRGSKEEIRAKMAAYLALFENAPGASDVLDVGCGRGEFLHLLGERGIPARGIDSNREMAARCRAEGLNVEEADALEYLTKLDDGSLGGLIAAQVVEHLQPDYLLRLLEVAYHKLRPGSMIVLETVNPACWAAFFSAYIRDITHVQPIHPDTLSYLLTASGFAQVEIRYSAPYPAAAKLQTLELAPATPAGDESVTALRQLVNVFNENVEKINQLLFTDSDYAAIGQRL